MGGKQRRLLLVSKAHLYALFFPLLFSVGVALSLAAALSLSSKAQEEPAAASIIRAAMTSL